MALLQVHGRRSDHKIQALCNKWPQFKVNSRPSGYAGAVISFYENQVYPSPDKTKFSIKMWPNLIRYILIYSLSCIKNDLLINEYQ